MVSRVRRWAMPLAMLVALAWLAAVLAQWTWQLLPAPPEAERKLAAPPAPVMNKPQPRLADSINAASLWGQPPVTDAEHAQDTRLPLALRGVLAGSGLALISASGQAEKVYRVGDDLPGGARLRAVHEDHVLLERAGVLERLALPKEGLQSAAPAVASVTPTAPSLRNMLTQSPAELAREFRLEPVSEAGQLRGYRIRPLRDPALLERVGMEPDDILLSINGRSLAESADLPSIMNELRDATALDATVLRNGIEMPLHIDLNG